MIKSSYLREGLVAPVIVAFERFSFVMNPGVFLQA